MKIRCREISYSGHSVRRMFERNIQESDVSRIIDTGEVIAEYPDDEPFPSCLVLGFVDAGPVHLVLGIDEEQSRCYVITVYLPDPDLWENDYQKRRA